MLLRVPAGKNAERGPKGLHTVRPEQTMVALRPSESTLDTFIWRCIVEAPKQSGHPLPLVGAPVAAPGNWDVNHPLASGDLLQVSSTWLQTGQRALAPTSSISF